MSDIQNKQVENEQEKRLKERLEKIRRYNEDTLLHQPRVPLVGRCPPHCPPNCPRLDAGLCPDD